MILREDKVPAGSVVAQRKTPRTFRGAGGNAHFQATGKSPLTEVVVGKDMRDPDMDMV